MYLAAFAIVYFLLNYRIRKKENFFEIDKNKLVDLLIYSIIGLLLGARLGYVIFYNLPYYLNHPLEILLPFKISCFMLHVSCFTYTGISGMSYFGGLVGVLIAGFIFSKKQKARSVKSARNGMLASGEQFNGVNFWKLADFVIPAIPAGYFFGRIGNFLNGELYGRATDMPWGMYFPGDSLGLLRHPSQLYEAFFEGIVLFLILWFLRNKKTAVNGQLLNVYLFAYGFFRFFIEFFREPDPKTWLVCGFITPGQAFSILIMIAGLGLILSKKRKNATM